MAIPCTNDELEFGATAVELGYITAEQLRETAQSDGGGSLRERLCRLRLLTPVEAETVAAAVMNKRSARHDAAKGVEAAANGLAAVEEKPPTLPADSLATPPDRFATQRPLQAATTEGSRFTVLRQHQQGGLGRLLIARDEELNREIALKEILPAYADDQENRRRFIREAEITGALEHPGVVPVYSLGAYSDGRPYYAMRLIHGVDLRTAIEDFHQRPRGRAEKRLAFRQLLARFVTVCQAMDYAHNRGVIHRDLKPGNIMLGDYGETLVVDWGLAKTVDERPSAADFHTPAVSPSERAHSDRTQAGRIVGTTQYMSPEQAAGRIDLLSPASDIYGLGATLYHLLAGRPAFDAADNDVVLRVQQGRFPKPREHCRQSPRALEAVCLKAMAQKAEDRYATARELALDVERYLADERVLAYREPISARAWRWIRRHRTPVMTLMAAGAVLVAALLVGMGLLKAQRDRAEHNFQLAQQAVRDYFVQVSEETLLNQPGMQPLRDALLRQALAYYERFLNERQDDASLRREVALAHFYVGRITETIASPEKAISSLERAAQIQKQLLGTSAAGSREGLRREYAQTLNAWGRALQNLERLEPARQRYEQAAALREEIATAAPDDAEAARALASTLMNLGLVDLMTGNVAAGLPHLERAQSLRLAHAEADSGDAAGMRRDLGMGYYNLAQAHLAAGNGAAAETHLAAAIEAFEKLASDTPADLGNRRRLAICLRLVGDLKAADADAEAAIESYQRARDSLGELATQNPSVPQYVADLAGVRMNLAQQLDATGDAPAALREVEAAVDGLRGLSERAAALPRQRCDLGVALRFAGQLEARAGRVDEARSYLAESKQVLQALVREHPGESTFATELQLTADALSELDAI
ncbi:MAG: protein kinase [Pirellulales bacterium]|nr:protein kinase [Pirellulales bacterium]